MGLGAPDHFPVKRENRVTFDEAIKAAQTSDLPCLRRYIAKILYDQSDDYQKDDDTGLGHERAKARALWCFNQERQLIIAAAEAGQTMPIKAIIPELSNQKSYIGASYLVDIAFVKAAGAGHQNVVEYILEQDTPSEKAICWAAIRAAQNNNEQGFFSAIFERSFADGDFSDSVDRALDRKQSILSALWAAERGDIHTIEHAVVHLANETNLIIEAGQLAIRHNHDELLPILRSVLPNHYAHEWLYEAVSADKSGLVCDLWEDILKNKSYKDEENFPELMIEDNVRGDILSCATKRAVEKRADNSLRALVLLALDENAPPANGLADNFYRASDQGDAHSVEQMIRAFSLYKLLHTGDLNKIDFIDGLMDEGLNKSLIKGYKKTSDHFINHGVSINQRHIVSVGIGGNHYKLQSIIDSFENQENARREVLCDKIIRDKGVVGLVLPENSPVSRRDCLERAAEKLASLGKIDAAEIVYNNIPKSDVSNEDMINVQSSLLTAAAVGKNPNFVGRIVKDDVGVDPKYYQFSLASAIKGNATECALLILPKTMESGRLDAVLFECADYCIDDKNDAFAKVLDVSNIDNTKTLEKIISVVNGKGKPPLVMPVILSKLAKIAPVLLNESFAIRLTKQFDAYRSVPDPAIQLYKQAGANPVLETIVQGIEKSDPETIAPHLAIIRQSAKLALVLGEYAVKQDKNAALDQILQAGPDQQSLDDLLCTAVAYSNVDAIAALRRSGADPNAQPNGEGIGIAYRMINRRTINPDGVRAALDAPVAPTARYNPPAFRP